MTENDDGYYDIGKMGQNIVCTYAYTCEAN